MEKECCVCVLVSFGPGAQGPDLRNHGTGIGISYAERRTTTQCSARTWPVKCGQLDVPIACGCAPPCSIVVVVAAKARVEFVNI